MSVKTRSDFEKHMASGACPFFFYELPPRCWIVRVAMKAQGLLDEDEAAELSEQECGGSFPDCCFLLKKLWDVPEVCTGSMAFRQDDVIIEFSDIPPEEDVPYDALVIPTTTLMQQDSIGRMPRWPHDVLEPIFLDLGLIEPPLPFGGAVVTRGIGTGYRNIIHAAIFDDLHGGAISLDSITSATAKAVAEALNYGARSISFCPMSIVAPDVGGIPPTPDMVQAVLSGIDGADGISRFRICVPDKQLAEASKVWKSIHLEAGASPINS